MTLSRLLLTTALLAATALPAAAQEPPPPRPTAQQGAQDGAPAQPPAAPAAEPETATQSGEAPAEPVEGAPLTYGLAGPYLAARMAAVQNDFLAAARYYQVAVQNDPGNRYLQDSALVALISAGQIDRAVSLAQTMSDQNGRTELSGLVDRARLAREGDWQALLDLLGSDAPTEASPQGPELLDGMLRAWAELGAGRASEAMADFEALTSVQGAAPMVNYHLALARALAGDFEGAESLLQDQETGAHILGYIVHAQVLAQLDRRDEAVALLDSVPGVEAEPALLALRERLQSDEPVAFDVIDTPQDGIAQVFLTFATALMQGAEPEPLSLIHARLGAWIAPDLIEARLMVAQLLMAHQQLDLAEAEFTALREMGEVRPIAELSRIDALSRADRYEEAEAAANALTEANPDLPQAWIAKGDVLRQQNKFGDAIPAYDRALELLGEDAGDARWFPLYARGIALERNGQFDRAEADFLAALQLRPDQASLLNYLGYSWIDRNENLEQGLELIRQAVELAPTDGYILDSLAWAYYRLGRYQDAVEPMEQAVLTMSGDPVVNDHLGDVYWMVGRQREAEVQWRRALSLNPGPDDDVDPDRIRDKLERGLDAVLAEEAKAPAPRRAAEPRSEADAGPAEEGAEAGETEATPGG
ncbi:tetratricopeptide repeat protein (plasmid) [Paracoccus sp. TK19116]|uniref:Tetratricopeptide repeat protein n=1 Tax=Paracoccus albicereus TaxID=2922394 RepID=A0ABT1ML25_9RHOB|nr:tetratricopeptide repeat protein [Paracoccus albicereus]MCQ0969000.1 tetratricopeptide repeat protein [Paracoccus albicereus]